MHRSRRSLPLGVDIGAERVSVVASDATADGFTVRVAETLEVPQGDTTLDMRIAETLRRIVASSGIRERRAILAAPPVDVVTRAFRVPPGMRRAEAERAAMLEADSLVDWPAAERLVALDPLPHAGDEMLLSVALNGTIERIVAIARAAGLRAVAVDVPACAWRRAVPEADALLDCSTERATLVVFGRPVGVVHVFAPRLVDERLATSVRAALVDARREGLADVANIAILGSAFRTESIGELLAGDGYVLRGVRLGEHDNPAWTFAYGLASWSIAGRGLVAS